MENNSGSLPKGGSGNKHIYKRGADDGFWLGLYFIATCVAMVAGVTVVAANVLSIALSIGVIPLTYWFLRRTFVEAHGLLSFSALWMQGIVMFACGSLILAAVGFVYLRWIDPDFIVNMVRQAIGVYQESPSEDARMLAQDFQKMIDMHMIPSALNMSLVWLWMGMFSGSILSLIIAVFVRARRVNKRF